MKHKHISKSYAARIALVLTSFVLIATPPPVPMWTLLATAEPVSVSLSVNKPAVAYLMAVTPNTAALKAKGINDWRPNGTIAATITLSSHDAEEASVLVSWDEPVRVDAMSVASFSRSVEATVISLSAGESTTFDIATRWWSEREAHGLPLAECSPDGGCVPLRLELLSGKSVTGTIRAAGEVHGPMEDGGVCANRRDPPKGADVSISNTVAKSRRLAAALSGSIQSDIDALASRAFTVVIDLNEIAESACLEAQSRLFEFYAVMRVGSDIDSTAEILLTSNIDEDNPAAHAYVDMCAGQPKTLTLTIPLPTCSASQTIDLKIRALDESSVHAEIAAGATLWSRSDSDSEGPEGARMSITITPVASDTDGDASNTSPME